MRKALPVALVAAVIAACSHELAAPLPDESPLIHRPVFSLVMGSAVDLGTLDGALGTWSDGLGLNSTGQVVGVSWTVAGQRAFLWDNGSMTNLGTLGGTLSQAQAINDGGQIVGRSTASDGSVRAFLYEAGLMTELDLEVAYSSAANGINTAGQVVGSRVMVLGEQSRAVLWDAGTVVDLGSFAGGQSEAYGINDAGQVVGVSRIAPTQARAFLWEAGTMSDLGTLGGTWSAAQAINSHGHVAGWSRTASGAARAFLWADGTMTDLGTLGGTTSLAHGINDAGQVVGYSDDVNGEWHAFLWENGTMTPLAHLGGTSSSAQAINNAGQVAGSSETPSGDWRAMLVNTELPPPPIFYAFEGFFRPIENLPTINVVQAGRSVPVKFSLGGFHGLDVFADGYPRSVSITCDGSAPASAVDEVANSTGGSGLTYDATSDEYTFVWKTDRAWNGSCRELTVRFDDGSERATRFRFGR